MSPSALPWRSRSGFHFLCKDVTFGFSDVLGAIDFNVLMMMAGTMGIVLLFIESQMPMRIADILLSKLKNIKTAIVDMARDFMKISVPFTLTAVLSGYLFIWLFWGIL